MAGGLQPIVATVPSARQGCKRLVGAPTCLGALASGTLAQSGHEVSQDERGFPSLSLLYTDKMVLLSVEQLWCKTDLICRI